MTKSILSEQREADEAQLRVLEGAARGLSSEDPYNYLPRGVSAGHALWAAARIRALSEALQEACHERDGLLAKVPEWQPIETAPRDGTDVLLWTAVRGTEIYIAVTGYFCEVDDAWCATVAAGYSSFINPTHWMPLPTPPGEK